MAGVLKTMTIAFHAKARLLSILIGWTSFVGISAKAQIKPLICAENPAPVPDRCSYTDVNKTCYVRINRLVPAQPPTILERPGGKVFVVVDHQSPFEILSLDFASAAESLPTDTFASAYNAFSPNIGKLTFALPYRTPGANFLSAEGLIQPTESANKIREEQAALYADAPLSIFTEVFAITQPPPRGLCANLPKTTAEIIPEKKPWLDTERWTEEVDKRIDAALTPNGLTERVAAIQAQIANLQAPDNAFSSQLIKFQKEVDAQIGAIDTAKASVKLAKLKAALQSLSGAESGAGAQGEGHPLPQKASSLPPVEDPGTSDRTNVTLTWALHSVQKLESTTKRVYTDDDWKEMPLSGLGPGTQTVLTNVVVQFQPAPRIDFTSGLVVPVLANHSYDKAARANNGAITDTVVQKTLTYTVVPMALANYRLSTHSGRRTRFGLYGSAGIGYNPASSSVEFGAGPSFAWNSFVLTMLLDIGRDTRLRDGFSQGQSLGTSNPPSPPTHSLWRVNPAIGISVRIPLSPTK